MDFVEFGLDERLLKGIEAAGYVSCTPVQEEVIKASQDGSDLYVQSQTGTGKTAAYLVAVINEMITKEEAKGKKLLVLVPTRELAVQVEEEAKVLVGTSGLKAFSVYGGVGYEKQISTLKKGVDIVIGTPGRVIDLQEAGNLDLSNAAFCVIDEADRMFDMGFYPDLRQILKCIPEAEERQTMLFSATLNSYVKNLAWEYTRDPKEITIEAENITVSEIQQELLHVSSSDKMKLLIGILKNENPASAIVFCNTKRSCEVVAKRLQINDIKADFLIGDLPQSKRLKLLNSFKAGQVPVLVATDVAARGIDVDDLAMVINFDLPVEAENYVHRIGRTARAGKSGKAYTFCSEQDVYNLPAIERYVEMSIPSSVAFEDQMLEDKSAGMYIKTENWHDDDTYDNRGGRRKGDRNYRKGEKGERGGRDFHDGRDGKKRDYKKDGYKKDFKSDYKSGDFKKSPRKGGKKPYINPDKLSQMSYEERMKFYKERYGTGNSSAASGDFKKGKKDFKLAAYKKGGKNAQAGKGNYKKNAGRSQAAAPAKKSLWQKIKSFFGVGGR